MLDDSVVQLDERRIIWKRSFASAIGNIMEGYDFGVYGFLAPIFARNFFPSQDEIGSLLSAFAAFAVAFLMRPLGGVVFGHIADRYGRGRSLMVSTTLMTLATLLIGFLPTAATVGLLAPIALVLLRALQGLSVGGEYTTSVTFLAESVGAKRRGLISSLAPASMTSGILLGSVTGMLVSLALPPATVDAWAWRLPFFPSLLLGGLTLWLRSSLRHARWDTDRAPAFPILEALRTDWRPMLQVFLSSAMILSGFYILSVYSVTFFQQIDRLKATVALQANTASLLVSVILTIVFGHLSDYVGRRRLMVASAAIMLCLTWPLFRLLSSHHVFLKILAGQMALSAILAMFIGAIPAAMAESVSGRSRCSAISASYGLAAALTGGTAPMIATALVDPHARHPMGPALYLMVWAAVSLLSSLTMKETRGTPLPS